MHSEEYKLDNPVWHSLSETHNQYAVEYNDTKFYHPDFCPFGGTTSPGDTAEAILHYADTCNNFFLVGNKPVTPDNVHIKKELVCDQMIIHNTIDIPYTSKIIQLTETHTNELLTLVNLVQPGYFKNKTPQLGNYFGIYIDNVLAAVTGERMKMHMFTEVSAVITHPDHTGQGYAKQLVAHTVNNIIQQGKTPYLHVADTNTGAIALYKKLGFATRRKISFWNMVS